MKRKNYDIQFKLEVVAYARKYNKSKAAKDKKVPRVFIQDWTEQKAQLEAQLKVSSSSISSRKRLQRAGRPLKDKDFDEKLISWVSHQRQKKLCVSRTIIQKEALTSSTDENFKASNGWLEKFLLRHNLFSRRPTTTCQKELEKYAEKIVNYLSEDCQIHCFGSDGPIQTSLQLLQQARVNVGDDGRELTQKFDADTEGDVNDEDSYNSDVSLDFHL